ncbi:metallophosphoesterase, partial [Achromatium sp. WMS1]
RLGQDNIQVFVVYGNHDATNRMINTMYAPANMKILSAKKAETIILEDLSVAIHGRSFGTQHVTENLVTSFNLASKDLFNIGLVHTSLDGREGHANYAPCSVDDLRAKGYQYWALGHVHNREVISSEPHIVFPGCIQGRHIRETGAKGCILVTVEDGSVSAIDDISLDVLRWSLCAIDVDAVENLQELLDRVRTAIIKEQALVKDRPLAMRIRLQGVTKMANELAAYPDRFEHQIKALGAEIAGDNLWIERVENVTKGKLDLATTLADNTPMGLLMQDILHMPNDLDNIYGIKDKIIELKQKLPVGTLGIDSTLNLDDEQTINQLIIDAKNMLIGR